ncbi:hypothetical protein HDU93_007447 [Gonapodya sp. JEL0774]|nr:hypothetical protein HDU93_007447 [Gonapodya sp. JEL0774]
MSVLDIAELEVSAEAFETLLISVLSERLAKASTVMSNLAGKLQLTVPVVATDFSEGSQSSPDALRILLTFITNRNDVWEYRWSSQADLELLVFLGYSEEFECRSVQRLVSTEEYMHETSARDRKVLLATFPFSQHLHADLFYPLAEHDDENYDALTESIRSSCSHSRRNLVTSLRVPPRSSEGDEVTNFLELLKAPSVYPNLTELGDFRIMSGMLKNLPQPDNFNLSQKHGMYDKISKIYLHVFSHELPLVETPSTAFATLAGILFELLPGLDTVCIDLDLEFQKEKETLLGDFLSAFFDATQKVCVFEVRNLSNENIDTTGENWPEEMRGWTGNGLKTVRVSSVTTS